MYCWECGEKLDWEDEFCPECGTDPDESTYDEDEYPFVDDEEHY